MSVNLSLALFVLTDQANKIKGYYSELRQEGHLDLTSRSTIKSQSHCVPSQSENISYIIVGLI